MEKQTFPSTTLTGVSMTGGDYSNLDLRGQSLAGQTLFGTDLRGSLLHGCTISIDCRTFDGVKLDPRQVAMLLLLLAQADIAPSDQKAIVDTAKWVHDGCFADLQALMRLA